MQYLVAIHLPDDFDPLKDEDDVIRHDIDVLNEEMVAAGIRVFVGGLRPVSDARSLTAKGDGEVVVTGGSYMKGSEHIGGFWVLDVASEAEAVEWGRKAVIACRAPVEVRPFH